MTPLKLLLFFSLIIFTGCPADKDAVIGEIEDITYQSKPVSQFWKNATVYFLMTDRFNNGKSGNDLQFERLPDGGVARSFSGGDIAGVTQKIEAGYFDSLGVNAIWLTPVFSQIKGFTDEGTGKTYAYHGYWTNDWTTLDPNFGTERELRDLVLKAHQHGIRVLLDAVINHTGPVTLTDEAWPDAWVRMEPTCTNKKFSSTVTCTLVDNLPDIKTESTLEVTVPDFLQKKWEAEGRLTSELSSLNTFFEETGYPRYPFYHIVKWLVDWVRALGVDGFRIDTAKHTEGYVWSILKKECEKALETWRNENPELVIHDDPFYMVGEVYGYGITQGRFYDYGDKKVDFFNYGFESLINFEFKSDASLDYDELFTKYSNLLNHPKFKAWSVLNYLSSHDDSAPYDPMRTKSYEAANKLLLTPGAAQIYYGDETARPLQVEGANGDANLRSFMNWTDLVANMQTRALLMHWQRLGKFRAKYPAIGAGIHTKINQSPYTFSRTLPDDPAAAVIIGLDHPTGKKNIPVDDVFQNGTIVRDHYSGISAEVRDGAVTLETDFTTLLIAPVK